MRANFRLGRILGIEIGANWSWLIVFALVLWSLAVSVFPAQNRGLSHAAYWAMAAVAAICLFASILLHELGHALVARREGVEIDGITLWLFGGVARLRGMYPSAGGEFRIAIAGPLVSAGIAAVLLVVAALTPLPEAIDGTVFWIGYINAVVLVFNVIPALPLDGGRILHAALWAWRRDLVWATRVGTAIGRGFGWLMIGGGIASFVLGRSSGGLWLAFVGWFVNLAAQAEAQQVIARERLGGLRVRDLIVDAPVTADPNLTIGELIDEVARRHRHSAYPVVEDGRVVGMLPFGFIAATPRREWDERRVRDCMIPRDRVPIVREGQAAADAFQQLVQSDLGRALVVDNGHLAGVLSIEDLARAIETRRR